MVNRGWRSKGYLSKKWQFINKCYDKGILEIAMLFDESGMPVSAGMVFINSYISVRWVILYIEAKYTLWNNVYYIISKTRYNNMIIDFGRGGYDYKIDNFKPIVENLYQLAYGNSYSGRFKVWLDFNKYYLKQVLKRTRLYKCIRKQK